MHEPDSKNHFGFWRTVGLASGASLLFALGYAVIRPGGILASLSDSLCVSALLLGAASSIPFLLDAGRGLTLGAKMTSDKSQQKEVLQEERRKREQGMRITFALALAAFLIGLASLVISLVV